MDEHRYTLEVLAPVLIVRQQGTLADVATMRRMQHAIELQRSSSRAVSVLFDNRRTGIHDEVVRKAMWSWVLSAGFARVGLLLDSELSVVRANMDAVARRATLRAFSRESEALAWLRAARPPGEP